MSPHATHKSILTKIFVEDKVCAQGRKRLKLAPNLLDDSFYTPERDRSQILIVSPTGADDSANFNPCREFRTPVSEAPPKDIIF